MSIRRSFDDYLSIRVGASIQEQLNHLQKTIHSGDHEGGGRILCCEYVRVDAYPFPIVRVRASIQEQPNHLQMTRTSGFNIARKVVL